MCKSLGFENNLYADVKSIRSFDLLRNGAIPLHVSI